MISNTKLVTLIILKYDHFTSLAKQWFLIVLIFNTKCVNSMKMQKQLFGAV